MNKSQDIDLIAFLHKVVENNSTATLVLVLLGIGVWLVGGNMLVARHYRRLGKPSWSGFKPFAFPFTDFDAKEWATLFALAIVSLSLFGLAVSFNANSAWLR